ncbi:E3 ubiquitin-protein ligase E3D-like isoform X2 [Ptychodera flava]|uniref:E3 ubiquitin-protein ligase E3D-like isoform X2 n=1 Tax=Ptychodera flava TaxID=63121 RepID=UPI003969E061
MTHNTCPESVCGIFIEARESIHASHVVIDMQNLQDWERDISKVKVIVETSSIKVTSSDGLSVIFPLPDIRLVPQSCHSLQWMAGEGLHMRLETQYKANPPDGVSFAGESLNLREEIELLSSQKYCQFACKVCGANILRANSHLKRVLQLPSENWQDVLDDWYCHGNTTVEKMKKTCLIPKENDCFVGNLYISIGVTSLLDDSLDFADSSCHIQTSKDSNVVIKCAKCHAQLGETSAAAIREWQHKSFHPNECVKLYKHCITVPGNCELFKSYSLESYFAHTLKIRSLIDTGFRYIVQSESGNQTAVALIWLMNTDTKLITNMATPNTALHQFVGPHYQFDDSHQQSLMSYSIVKILFQSCIGKQNKGLLAEWLKDSAVQSIMLPYEHCLQILLLLFTNNNHLPKSQRTNSHFKVSYLRLK